MDRAILPITWQAPEYVHTEKTNDWFWALGLVAAITVVALVIFGNYTFAGFVLFAAGMLGYYARRRPAVLSFELNNKGIVIASTLYPYESIKSFWIDIGSDPEKLIFMSSRPIDPMIVVPLGENAPIDDIHTALLQLVEEKEL